MTKKELSQLYYLNREIKKDRERLEELETKATNITQGVSGMPFSSGISDKTGRYAVEIAEQKKLIEAKLSQCIILENKIYCYINAIEDSLTRQIFTERYIELKSWYKIARSVEGNNTSDSVRMIHNRFLKKQRQRG